jgi:hypothetical protein
MVAQSNSSHGSLIVVCNTGSTSKMKSETFLSISSIKEEEAADEVSNYHDNENKFRATGRT